jgi:transposase
MTDDTPRRYERMEVLSGVERRRRWTPEEKVRMVEETYLPGMSVSLVAHSMVLAPISCSPGGG